MLQREVGITIFLIMNDGMAMEECATCAVLTGNSDRMTAINQCRIGHVFSITPVHQGLALTHLNTTIYHFGDCWMQFVMAGIPGY